MEETYKDKQRRYKQEYNIALQNFMKYRNSNYHMSKFAQAAYFANDYENAIKYFHLLEDINDYKEFSYIYLADMYSKLGNLMTALKYANKAIKIPNTCIETNINKLLIKAEIQYRMGDYDVALNNFLKAYELGDDDRSLCYISKIYILKNEFMKAMKYLRIIAHYGDNNPDECFIKLQNSDIKTQLEFLDYLLKRYELKPKL